MKQNRYILKQRVERILGLVALLVLVLASILGNKQSSNDNETLLLNLLKQDQHLQVNSNNIYEVFSGKDTLVCAYIFNGESLGYGGPIELAIRVDTNIIIQNLVIINHNETPSYVTKVIKQQFPRQLIGKTYTDEFSIQSDLDAVTGATYTSLAIAAAGKEACRRLAEEQKNMVFPEQGRRSINFGLPEVLLILLYGISLFGVYSKIRWKKALRWGIMIVSLITLGFWLCIPLSLLKINSILLGYWPEWHTGMYWYMLIGGGLLTLILTNKRVYCTWICPFGAAQNCLGFIGKARNRIRGKGKNIFQWVQRGLAFAAIASALYFRNPGTISFEIFGTFFNLTGTTFLFILTGIYTVSSLFTKSPYCHTLCPITPIEEFILMIRRLIFPKQNPPSENSIEI